MLSSMRVLLLLLLVTLAWSADYDGWSLAAVEPTDGDARIPPVGVWMDESLPRDGVCTVIADAAMLEHLRRAGWNVEIQVVDVGPLMRGSSASQPAVAGAREEISFHDSYHSLAEIRTFVDDLVAAHPDRLSLQTIGTSVEGRPIRMVRVGGGDSDSAAILVTSLQHAREWVAVASTLGCLERLAEAEGADAWLVQERTWYIVPVVNPDGYEYSWTTDRLWRKNRSDNGDGTMGVDLNRNWSHAWGGSGSSGSGGSSIYRGPLAFSEPETDAVRDFAAGLGTLAAHVDIHSYSQLVLRPYSCCTEAPDYPDQHQHIGDAMAMDMEAAHGESYTHIAGYDLYFASGTATDWFAGQRHVLSWTLELRPDGSPGFLLPADQIVPTTDEAWAALTAVAAGLEASGQRRVRIRVDAGNGGVSTTVTTIPQEEESVALIEHPLEPWPAALGVRLEIRREEIAHQLPAMGRP